MTTEPWTVPTGIESGAEVVPGLRIHRNLGNKFTVAFLSYLADPAKRDPAWKEQAKAGMPDRGWAREYELSFDAPAGDAVFPEWTAAHIRPIRPLADTRILRGWDFGATAPAVVFAQTDPWGRLLVHAELVLAHLSLGQLIDAVQARTLEVFGRLGPCFDAGDPQGEAMTDLGQIRRELMKANILLQTTRTGESYDAMRARLLRSVHVAKEGVSPALLVHPRCVNLIEAMAGAFHYPERPSMRDPRPVPTHPYKDVVDALRYLHDNLLGLRADHIERMKHIAKIDRSW